MKRRPASGRVVTQKRDKPSPKCQRNRCKTAGAAPKDTKVNSALRDVVGDVLVFNSLILANAPIGILVYKATGQCVSANPAAARVTGGTVAQLLAQDFRRLKSWKIAGMLETAEKALAAKGLVRHEFHGITTFGKESWFEARFLAYRSKRERYLLLLIQDISERKQAEEAMRVQSQRYELVILGTRDAIWDWDVVKKRVLLSPQWKKMRGFIEADITDHEEEWSSNIHPEDAPRVMGAVQAHFEGKTDVFSEEYRVHCKDGSWKWILDRGIALRNESGRVIRMAGSETDITERKRAEEERDRLSVQLREAHKLEAIGRFGRGVAHDFNNLMATVLGVASNMRSKRQPDDPDYAKLTYIEEAAETAAKLAHQLLDFAKGGTIRPHLLPFAKVIKSALALVPPMVPQNVVLDHQIESDLWNVKCDQTQIQQVIVNLCSNALEAMPKGGRLTIRAENVALASSLTDAQPPLAAGEYVCLTVEDTGCGMDAKTMKRIFDPFFTTKERGHGLGLAAAYGVMAGHGGAISVASAPGKGSAFGLWLPRAKNLSP